MQRSITFEPVTEPDMALLRRWLRRPHLQEWWGDPEIELGYIRDMIEGRDTTRPFIFHVDGEPAGYIQYWFVGHWRKEPWIRDNPWLEALPDDAIGVDLSIAKPELLSQGIGSDVLRLFCQQLHDRGYGYIIIDPDPENTRAVRAYEKAGFHQIPEFIGASDDVLIMKFEPARKQSNVP